MSRPVLAGYDGECGICTEPITEGEEIVNVDGDWCHADSAEDEGFEVDRG